MRTVEEILQRPMFESAHVVNQKADLKRDVRWVHVLEITEFETLLRGNEMILSTGVALDGRGVDYVKKLIANDVACLCIELGEHFSAVPKDMIELADTHQFPIIVFTSIVRFVDITHDVHAELINSQHHQLSELDRLSNEFHQLTLHAHGNMKILKKLQSVTDRELIFLPTDDTSYFLPALDKQEQTRVRSEVHKTSTAAENNGSWFDEKRQKSFRLKPIEAMGQKWGFVLMRSCVPLTSFETHALDRATASLAQNLLRIFYTEEKKLLAEHSWIHDLIEQKIKTENEALSKLYKSINSDLTYRICVVKMSEPSDQSTDTRALQYQAMRHIRSLFQKHGLESFITISQNNTFLVLSVDKQFDDQEKKRIAKTVAQLEKTSQNFHLHLFTSQTYHKLLEAHLAFQEAENVMKLDNMQTNATFHFYEDIGAYQLLLKLDDVTINGFIHTYLSPLLRYDRDKNSTLLHTLHVYLKLNCSKQQSAQELQIARQTLYQRLDKIEQLLGWELTTNPHVRVATEVAIAAYHLTRH
ncbi:PucR family transcriptional regulator ligand-binding domain-containing protein [Salicibibacter cibi]|uniref:PucR family transcriptional regulator ligand-binding domain-containing protein n=1 Tax=Salicibibacter cibi TaxID=2743001 RepID=A0A7T7CE72_9BACI|nr:PucR family transcriptional regulator [Salicibibacter cibi]QQK78753.1 PucR family transcriptional regulator ligand-binding domain-containing protein [Salicibibacter cibi]